MVTRYFGSENFYDMQRKPACICQLKTRHVRVLGKLMLNHSPDILFSHFKPPECKIRPALEFRPIS